VTLSGFGCVALGRASTQTMVASVFACRGKLIVSVTLTLVAANDVMCGAVGRICRVHGQMGACS
jgi:hypothetical protein